MPWIPGDEVLSRVNDNDLAIGCRGATVSALDPDFHVVAEEFDASVTKPPTGSRSRPPSGCCAAASTATGSGSTTNSSPSGPLRRPADRWRSSKTRSANERLSERIDELEAELDDYRGSSRPTGSSPS